MRRNPSLWWLFGCAACVLALAVGLSACGDDSDEDSGAESSEETHEIRVANVPASLILILTEVGQEQGFFDDHGVEVTAEIPTLPFTQLPNALGREYDLITSSIPNVVAARESGRDLVVDSATLRDSEANPLAALVVPPDSPIRTINDLAGRSVGAPATVGSNWTTLLCWAQQEGLEADEFRGVEAPTPQIPDLLKRGRFDAALLFQPGYGQLVDDGFRVIGNSYFECFEERALLGEWVGLGDWVRENQDALERFHAALEDAVAWIEANPEEADELWFEVSGLPREVAEGAPPSEHTEAYEINADRAVLLEEARMWLEVMRDVGVYEGDLQASDLLP